MRSVLAFTLLVCALGLAVAGCGGDDEGSGTEEPPPATTQTTGGEAVYANNLAEVRLVVGTAPFLAGIALVEGFISPGALFRLFRALVFVGR